MKYNCRLVKCPFDNCSDCLARYNFVKNKHEEYCHALNEAPLYHESCPFYKAGGKAEYKEMCRKINDYKLMKGGD